MKQIFFARHGLSEMNRAGLFSGHTETALTEKGRFQAKQAGRQAKEQGLRFDTIIASPLSRAYETARIIAEEIGYPPENVQTHDLLKERNYGSLEGKPYYSIDKSLVDSPFVLDQIPGIETISELHQRAKLFIEWLNSSEHTRILLVSHGSIGRAIRRTLDQKEIHEPVPKFDNAVIHQIA